MRLKVSFRGARLSCALAYGVTLLGAPALAHAAETTPKERQLTPEEIDSWLDSRAMPKSQDHHATDDDDAAAPPPPPHQKGFLLARSVGGKGQHGSHKH